MSAIIILTPVVIGSWPVISAAVVGAASALGYAAAARERVAEARRHVCVDVDVENSEVVTEGLAAGETMAFEKDGVIVSFMRDPRGQCRIQVMGENRTTEELQQIGTEVSERVTQQFVYNKVATELRNRNFEFVEEEVDENQTIRIHVRNWCE